MSFRVRVDWLLVSLACLLASCISFTCIFGTSRSVRADSSEPAGVAVAVVRISRTALGRSLTFSSRLVPFEEIYVYDNESGYVKQLDIDHGVTTPANMIVAQELPEPRIRISRDDSFRLMIPVPESYVQYIHVGTRADVLVPSLGRTLPGKVTHFSVRVREETRTIYSEVVVRNPNRILTPGMYAQATVTLEHGNDVLSLPLQALNQTNGQTTVDLVDPSNKIQIRQVELGIQTPFEAEVISGLKEGDKVVVSDRGSLRPGEPVRAQVLDLVQN